MYIIKLIFKTKSIIKYEQIIMSNKLIIIITFYRINILLTKKTVCPSIYCNINVIFHKKLLLLLFKHENSSINTQPLYLTHPPFRNSLIFRTLQL